MPAPPDLTGSPFALLSLIAAPAVLTNAASVLALSTSNRFLRASERMRALSVRMEKEKETLPDDVRKLLLEQTNRTERQAHLLLGGLRAAYVALGSFATASLISILGAGVASSPVEINFHVFSALALGVGMVGAGGLVWACGRLMGATRLSMLNMSEEAELIRRHERTSSAPV